MRLFYERLKKLCYCKKHVVVSPEKQVCVQPRQDYWERCREVERKHQEELEVNKMWLMRNSLVLFCLREKSEKELSQWTSNLSYLRNAFLYNHKLTQQLEDYLDLLVGKWDWSENSIISSSGRNKLKEIKRELTLH